MPGLVPPCAVIGDLGVSFLTLLSYLDDDFFLYAVRIPGCFQLESGPPQVMPKADPKRRLKNRGTGLCVPLLVRRFVGSVNGPDLGPRTELRTHPTPDRIELQRATIMNARCHANSLRML